ncbi:FG-GAP-like repeat-containing protein [Streptomyces sp. NBC_01465]|uniref:FG-GAP-like repeat-containing protein n=1 Tax=Streptomyces sp. NBC_01465 TaxID=2903878 RepID=UPI002E351956|nr:FG-GAP-like repeat-containing protein [Streptomyces sp. NBC_01465]
MTKRSVRRSLLACALAAGVGGAVLLPLGTVTAQAADTGTEVVLDTPAKDIPRPVQLLSAGATGFLHRQGGRDAEGLLWTSYATGKTVSVLGSSGTYAPNSGLTCYYIRNVCSDGLFGRGSDTVAMPDRQGRRSVQLRDTATGALGTVDGFRGSYQGTYGSTVVSGYGPDEFEISDLVDGVRRVRAVTGLADSVGSVVVATGDARGAAVRYGRADGTFGVGYLDFATAAVTEAFADVPDADEWGAAPAVLLDGERIGWIGASSVVHLKSRADVGVSETVHTLADTSGYGSEGVLVGNSVVLAESSVSDALTGKIVALPLDGGPARVLLARAGQGIQAGPDGSALVSGGTANTDWWVQRIAPDAQGAPAVSKVLKVAPYENDKGALAFSRGHLRVVLGTTGSPRSSVTDLGVSGTPVPSTPVEGDTVPAGREIWGNHETGGDVFLSHRDGDAASTIVDGWSSPGVEFGKGTTGGTIVDAADGYVVYNSGGTAPKQYVGEIGQGVLLTGTARAAALNGPVLWRATGAAGQVSAYNLSSKKTTSTVTVGASCVPSELQAAGKWLYWSCGSGGASGVYDTVGKKSVAVTGGDVLLGDGFTVRHDHTAGTLLLTSVTGGTAVTRTLAELPDSGKATDRRLRWAVDEYTGMVAYVGGQEQVHVLGTGVAASPVAVTGQETSSGVFNKTPWTGNWDLSRPVASWTLTVKDPAGRVLRTITGRDARAAIAVSWNGRTNSNAYAPNGVFRWSLTAVPAGSTGAATISSGTGLLEGGAAVFRDYSGHEGVPDGLGDLMSLTSSGTLSFHYGASKLSGKLAGGGWPSTVYAVPLGDFNGDRCNDVLVRYTSGELRSYKPGCGRAVTPKTSYVKVGATGWQQYDLLTSPGDLNGDGRADLVVRQKTTGDMYFYAGRSDGKFAAKVKLASNWKTYAQIAGVGDITGDGRADLVAHDRTGGLWRYNGLGNGKFAARVKVFSNWGTSYNAIIGVGDITGDGRADLVERDSGGNLFRSDGNGKGSFGGRVQIATGWKGYKSLF